MSLSRPKVAKQMLAMIDAMKVLSEGEQFSAVMTLLAGLIGSGIARVTSVKDLVTYADKRPVTWEEMVEQVTEIAARNDSDEEEVSSGNAN